MWSWDAPFFGAPSFRLTVKKPNASKTTEGLSVRKNSTDNKTAKRAIAESDGKRTTVSKRIPRNKIQLLLDRIDAIFKYVPPQIKEEQLLTIERALTILDSCNDRKRYITEDEAVDFFTREQLQRMLLMKDGKMMIR